MKVLCALNPTSAGGLAMERWPQVVEHLERFRLDFELLADRDVPLETQLFDRLDAADGTLFEAVLGIGGDGTHSALINTLMRHKSCHPDRPLPPYAMLPLGTGNNIAKSFGMTRREDFFVTNLRRAVSAVCYGADYQLDLGRVGNQYFVDAFTLGLDPEILRERNVQKRRLERVPVVRQIIRGNYLLYTWAMGHRLLRKRPMQVEIAVDGVQWYSGPALNMVINNTRIYGAVFDFSLDSFACDGLLDVILFTNPGDYLTKCFLGLRTNPDGVLKMNETLFRVSSHRQGRRIEIRVAQPEAAQVDGEELPPGDHFVIECVPKAIPLKIAVEP